MVGGGHVMRCWGCGCPWQLGPQVNGGVRKSTGEHFGSSREGSTMGTVFVGRGGRGGENGEIGEEGKAGREGEEGGKSMYTLNDATLDYPLSNCKCKLKNVPLLTPACHPVRLARCREL